MALKAWSRSEVRSPVRHARGSVQPATGFACTPCVWCGGTETEVLAAIVATLEASGIFSGVDPTVTTEVAQQCTIIQVDANQAVFDEGEQCEGLWLLAKGRLRLYQSDPDGRQLVTRFISAGGSMQLSAALEGGRYGLSATALEDSMLIVIPRRTLRETLRTELQVARNIVYGLCRLSRQRDVLEATRQFLDSDGKLRCALIQMMHKYGAADGAGMRIDFRLTRQDLADYVGVTIETAIRVLSKLQQHGSLVTRAQVIEICDVEAFEAETGCSQCQFDCRTVFRANIR